MIDWYFNVFKVFYVFILIVGYFAGFYLLNLFFEGVITNRKKPTDSTFRDYAIVILYTAWLCSGFILLLSFAIKDSGVKAYNFYSLTTGICTILYSLSSCIYLNVIEKSLESRRKLKRRFKYPLRLLVISFAGASLGLCGGIIRSVAYQNGYADYTLSQDLTTMFESSTAAEVLTYKEKIEQCNKFQKFLEAIEDQYMNVTQGALLSNGNPIIVDERYRDSISMDYVITVGTKEMPIQTHFIRYQDNFGNKCHTIYQENITSILNSTPPKTLPVEALIESMIVHIDMNESMISKVTKQPNSIIFFAFAAFESHLHQSSFTVTPKLEEKKTSLVESFINWGSTLVGCALLLLIAKDPRRQLA